MTQQLLARFTRSRNRSPIVLLLITWLAVIGSASPSYSQTVGSIEGSVIDSSGGTLPGVAIQVTNEQTGIARTLVTDGEGRYRARDLALGEYRVEASLAGFQTVVRRGVLLTIGREAVVDFKLPIGGLTDSITVTGDAPLVNTTSSAVTALVAREQMENLPLSSRDFSQLITLQAGTTNVRAAEGGHRSGYGARISVSGSRPSSNVFTIDGSEVQTAFGQLPSGVTGATLGLEAVQEVKILMSNYSAQHGRSSGATVVAATRSGTNALRGSSYWYHRNESLDSRDYFDEEKPEFLRNQFGASAGGPVVKSRMFFFANYEGLREDLPLNPISRVPTLQARQGILPTGTVTVAEAVKPYLALWPAPTGRDFGDGTAEYQAVANRPTTQNYGSVRLDYSFSSTSNLFGRYTIDESDQSDPQTIGFFNNTRRTRNQYVTIEQKNVLTRRLVNQARASYTRTFVGGQREAVNPPSPSLSFYEGRPFGLVSVTNLLSLNDAESPRKDIVNSIQFNNDATLDLGRHSIHFGGVATRFEYNKLQFSREGGEWTFGSLSNFLQNRPSRLRIMGFNADPYRTFNQNMLAFYVQDDLKLHERLTLNGGVRWEYLTSPTERHGRLANLRDTKNDTTPTVGEPYYENPGGFFSPRLGFAWDPTGGKTTSIRGGFGLFHEPLLMRYYINAMDRQPPFWSDVDVRSVTGLFPNLNPHLEQLSKGPQAVHVFQYQPDNPYAMQWSASLQRSLMQNLVAELGYTGSRGVNLAGRRELAVPNPIDVNGESYYAPNAPFYNPSFTRLNYYDTSAKSKYHALKGTVTQRYSAGLHFQASYTWSKAMDTQSATLQDELGRTIMLDAFHPERDWALADFHVEHSFTANFGYQLPWGRELGGVTGALLGGWQLSGIFTATTGFPFTVTSSGLITHPLHTEPSRPGLAAGGDTNPVLGGPDQYFDPTQFVPQPRGFHGNVGRNTLIGPGFAKLDLSLMKDFQLGGRRTAQVRVETFNVTNRTNFGLPAALLFDAQGARVGSAGRITTTVTPARQVQLALRFGF
ncbi:MAG: TonB-dependent receptor [Acidobacteria bacterium]|nr:TonB-dependent receptor [Acidobacteriota bacterium]